MSRASLAVLASLALAMPVFATAPKTRATGKPIFATLQAQEGARVYAVRCAVCHGAMLDGSVEIPGLRGKFMANWAGRPVGDLYDYIARAMPQSAPGSLSDADNARLVAFLLMQNGLTGGSSPLPADRAILHRIVLVPVPPS